MELIDWAVIVLQVGACYACYAAGRMKGIGSTIDLFLDRKMITQEQLNKLVEEEQ